MTIKTAISQKQKRIPTKNELLPLCFKTSPHTTTKFKDLAASGSTLI